MWLWGIVGVEWIVLMSSVLAEISVLPVKNDFAGFIVTVFLVTVFCTEAKVDFCDICTLD